MKPSPASQLPILRILAPFVLGILLAWRVPSWWWVAVMAGTGVAGYAALWLVSRSPQARYAARVWFTLPIILMGIALGGATTLVRRPHTIDLRQINNRPVEVMINDITFRDFSMMMDVQLTGGDRHSPHILLTTRGCDYRLRAGDVVTIPGRLQAVANNGNPDEMDYRQYLADKGILYQEHIDVRRLQPSGHHDNWPARLCNLRHRMERRILASTLEPEVQHFVIAMLVGERRFIDNETRQAFSRSGVAHVLALSGLHLGIITLLLWWLFLQLDYLGARKLRLAITLCCIAAFVFFTGASPSVVRSAVMVGFSFAGLMFFRRNNALNALLVAALLILYFSPQALRSVGFQLSFITVASILLFAPRLERVRNRVLAYVAGTVITSVVAMLSTLALTAYYFHGVALLSVVANLLVLPIVPVFLMLAALFLVVCATGGEMTWLNTLLEWCYTPMDAVTGWLSHLSWGHIDRVFVTGIDVFCYFMFILLAYAIWHKPRRRMLWLLASLVLVAAGVNRWWLHTHTPRSGRVVFNTYNATPIMHFNHARAMLWVPDASDFDLEGFEHRQAAFLAHHGIEHVELGLDSLYTLHQGCVVFDDCLLVTRRFHGHVDKILKITTAGKGKRLHVVLTGSIYEKEHDRLAHECDSVGVPYTTMRRSGAIVKFDVERGQ